MRNEMNNLVPFEQQKTLARAFAESGLFGVKTAEQALALMALCEAEGMHPAKAIQRYHIVQGRPAMKAETMLAEFQKAGGKVDWELYTDEAVTGVFSHPQGGSVRIEWTLAKAKTAGLAGKDVWKNYARAMMRSRCISEGVRTVYPGVVEGVYTPEEIEALAPDARIIEGETVTRPTVDKEAVIARINAQTTREDLNIVWKGAVAQCRDAQDQEAYDAIKAAVETRGRFVAELEKAEGAANG
jgi:hypothetical protein